MIEKIDTYIVHHELTESFSFSQWEYDSRTICLVKVTDSNGEHGWGEGYGPAKIIKSGIDFFKPLIIGEDPLEQEKLWQTIYLHSMDYSRRGILLSALSAVDIALWDLKGKILQQPVSVLLGGRKRRYVQPYATGMYFSEGGVLHEKLAEEALLYKEKGFSAMKMKVGLGIKEDLKNIKAVRDAIGTKIDLMIDANHAYSLKEAILLDREAEKFGIGWFEEPISPEEYDNYSQLRSRASIPIAAGECEYLRSGFLHLFKGQCVDIAQPDICAAGGITEVKKICSMAQTFGVEVVPHVWGTGIAIHAALQVLSNWDINPGRMNEPVPLFELDQTENPLRDELVHSQLKLEDGLISIPERPGLGVEVNEHLLQKYVLVN